MRGAARRERGFIGGREREDDEAEAEAEA